jgi:DNA repair protein RadC
LLTTVLRHDGHAFAIGHNHPSGDPTPSANDRHTTLRCRTAAGAAGLTFLSHVVLGEHDS